MEYKRIKLKNADDYVFLDPSVFEHLEEHEHYGRIGLLDNLRRHSSGCAVFQKTHKQENGNYKIETIYLHKLVAETFLSEHKSAEMNLVGALNGNKLDCRLSNLVYRSRAWASRQRKTTSKSGYMGVYKENKRFRAVISHEGKSIHLGMFDTPEEAAKAYNEKSWELYGHMGKQNDLS